MSGNFDSASFDGSIGGFDVDGGPAPVVSDVIRNWSLRNWRRWKRDDLEEGELPPEERAIANEAILEAERAALQRQAGLIEAAEQLRIAMEARERYEQAFMAVYHEEYVAEIVARLWKADMRRLRLRKAAALLLLH